MDVVEHQAMLFAICTISVFRVRLYVQFDHESGNEFSFLKGDLRKTPTIKIWHDYSAESNGNKMASEEKHLNTEHFSITKKLHQKGASLDEKLLK